jgi:small subunit ribosomal protein S16
LGFSALIVKEHPKMVIIRLARGGAHKRPFFHLVATDSRSRRDGKFIERVGFFNPVASANETKLRISMDRVDYWRSNGAQVSPRVALLIKEFAAQAAA